MRSGINFDLRAFDRSGKAWVLTCVGMTRGLPAERWPGAVSGAEWLPSGHAFYR
jgi:hypothetical protein